MDNAINSPGYGKNAVDDPNANDKLYLKINWNFLVYFQVTKHKILVCFPVHHNIYPLNLHKNV